MGAREGWKKCLKKGQKNVKNMREKKNNLQKNPSNSWKVKKFHYDSVTNDSARAKKLEGGAKRPPPQPL